MKGSIRRWGTAGACCVVAAGGAAFPFLAAGHTQAKFDNKLTVRILTQIQQGREVDLANGHFAYEHAKDWKTFEAGGKTYQVDHAALARLQARFEKAQQGGDLLWVP